LVQFWRGLPSLPRTGLPSLPCTSKHTVLYSGAEGAAGAAAGAAGAAAGAAAVATTAALGSSLLQAAVLTANMPAKIAVDNNFIILFL
jgi:hypothetical protein